MAKKRLGYTEIMKLAKDYGVDTNAIFVSAAERYSVQVELIEKMRKQIETDGLMIEHTNVKGDVNSDVNPLTVQLPKYIDTANKTLSLMLDIIQSLGTTAPTGDKLGEFLNE